MSHKPKPVKDHYTESFSINSKDLEKQLREKSVQDGEIKKIVDMVSELYLEKVQEIVAECDRDIIALERAPTPLNLFINCISVARKNIGNDSSASLLLDRYVMAWEDWM